MIHRGQAACQINYLEVRGFMGGRPEFESVSMERDGSSTSGDLTFSRGPGRSQACVVTQSGNNGEFR